MNRFYQEVSLAVKEMVEKNYQLNLDYPIWELPARQKFGDLSTAASLRVASQTGQDPFDVAQKIKQNLAEKFKGKIEKMEVARPGFINLFFSQKILIETLSQIISQGKDYFKEKRNKKVLIEFVSANPTGPLSIAHGRQAVVGDVLANIRKALGDKVEREYYLNDLGRQIDLLVLSTAERVKEIEGKNYNLPEQGYKGQYLKEIARQYIKKGKPEDLRNFCLDYIKSLIKKDLNELNISFDNWFSQKQLVDQKKVEEVIKILKENNFIYQKEDALWFRSSAFSDSKDRVIKKSDGSLTYFASDIAYHYDKARRGYDQLINLWGPDHHGYIERIYACLGALGYKKELLTVVIIQLVSLKSKQRMSKRAGTLIRFSELIKEVGKDAARFYYLTRKNSSHLDFDIDLAKKSSFENPLYYIQYVCARIESIFKKANACPEKKHNQYINDSEEFNMIRLLLQFPFFLQRAYYLLEPAFIVEYLRNLAAAFHKFYEKVRVISDDPEKTAARLNILEAVRVVLFFGLEILGIKPVKKM